MVKDKNTRICIVGAGVAGIFAAHYLIKNGYSSITLLEKEDHIGGKCSTLTYLGQAYDLGAVEITWDSQLLIDLIKDMGFGLMPAADVSLLDYTTGAVYPNEYLTHGLNKFDLAKSVMKYLYELHRVRDEVSHPGFKNLTAELSQPFSDWLREKGMENLAGLFQVPVTCYGYGYLTEIPAAYVLKFMSFRNFATLLYIYGVEALDLKLHWPKRLTNGFQSFLEAVAENFPDVQTGVTINSINRPDESGEITVEIEGKSPLICDELFITTPQQTELLSYLDLRDDEKAVFDQVIVHHLFTTVCDVEEFSYNLYPIIVNDGKLQLPGNGYPFMMAKFWENSNISNFYSFSDQPINIADVQSNVAEVINQTGRKLNDMKETIAWNYFAHVNSESMANGFYDDLDALQGRRQTYYSGGLCNFEFVESVLEYSKYLVDTFFPA